MNEKALHTLEYDKIIEKLVGYAVSPMAKERAAALRPSAAMSDIIIWQEETTEATTMVLKKGTPSFGGFREIRPQLKRASMAETVKILSPEKKVYLSNSGAGCPMAEQLDVEMLSALKESNPDYTVVAYINTTSELKTICDVCVTSSSALKIVNNIDNDKILFIPDCNLGAWVEKQVPEKTFKFVHGGCPTHLRMSVRDVKKARDAHPEAKLLVHPECLPEVSAMADYIGSTTGIMKYDRGKRC